MATLLGGLAVTLDLLALQQVNQEELQTELQDLVASMGPLDIIAVVGFTLTAVASVRYLVKRAVPTGGTSGGAASTTVNTTAQPGGGTAKHKVAFTLPGILPISRGIREVTHNEIHAIELGFVVGLIATWLYATGNREPVVALVVAFVAGSLGYKRYSSKAFKTVRLEPWYALLALTGGALLGWAIFLAEPAIIELPST